jgi:hypothetical protein
VAIEGEILGIDVKRKVLGRKAGEFWEGGNFLQRSLEFGG